MNLTNFTIPFNVPFRKAEAGQSLLNVEETYNLWDLVNTKYATIDVIQIYLAFAHDLDFKLLLQKQLKAFQKDADALEKELIKHSIAGPDKPLAGVSTSVNPEVLNDERMGLMILTELQEEVELLLRAVRTATTNDNIRAMFIRCVEQSVGDLGLFIKFLKTKGWLNQPPLYPNVPAATQEKLDAGEAFHLWDHLTFRYDNIQATQVWYEHAHDADFKFLLKRGLQDSLKKQAEMLEKELIKFGIPLPKQPSSVVKPPTNTTDVDDDYLFRVLHIGIMGALWLHTLALKQCTTNDRIRDIFRDLLIDEVKILDKLLLMGKVKGWVNVVPLYSKLQ